MNFFAEIGTRFFLSALLCLILIAGCRSDSGGRLAEVEGTVTLDGQPLAGAEVIFRPANGRPSMGKTDGNGVYQLRYSTEKMGALVGTHTVTINTAGDESGVEGAANGQERVPAEYNTRTTLKVEVVAGQKDPIRFDLSTKRK